MRIEAEAVPLHYDAGTQRYRQGYTNIRISKTTPESSHGRGAADSKKFLSS